MVDKEAKTLAVNWDDELVKATLLTRGGAVVHPAFGGEAPPPAKPAVEEKQGEGMDEAQKAQAEAQQGEGEAQ